MNGVWWIVTTATGETLVFRNGVLVARRWSLPSANETPQVWTVSPPTTSGGAR